LYLAYYYAGTAKEYINNLVQFSKMQETSTYQIKNFFDTENNYQLATFFKIIHASKELLLMTHLQKSTVNYDRYKTSIAFLKELGNDYIDSYLLTIQENDEVIVNDHNLIKTIVFNNIYKNQDRKEVFKILSDIAE